MIIEFYPRRIFKAHIALISILLIANVLGIISKLYLDYDYVFGLIPLFDFNTEKNIPTLFSSIMMIVCSALLYLIAMNNKNTNSSFIPWLGLSLIFLFLSIDEISSIHEKFTSPSRESFETSGFLYYAWVIPYGVALIVFILSYTKFLLGLPKNIMLLFLLSGITFVTGAVGFEMLGGNQADNVGTKNLLYSIFYTCEEFLEMFGIAVFLYTLLTHIVNQSESLTIIVACKKYSE
jgi:hypothetical protein